MSAIPKLEGKHHEVKKKKKKKWGENLFWHEVFIELFYRKGFIPDYDNSSTLWCALSMGGVIAFDVSLNILLIHHKAEKKHVIR